MVGWGPLGLGTWSSAMKKKTCNIEDDRIRNYVMCSHFKGVLLVRYVVHDHGKMLVFSKQKMSSKILDKYGKELLLDTNRKPILKCSNIQVNKMVA